MVNQEFTEGYGTYTMDEFEFEYGRTLKNVQVEYLLRGTPKYDNEGNITNAIVHCHRFNGNATSFDELYEFTKTGEVFDKNEYCFISPTSMGFPESCSPSTTGLKHNFPKYSVKDCVNFKRQFLKECFGIERVHGIFGRGVGGYEVYTWACDYPDEMDFIIIFASSYKTNGYRYVVSKIMDSMIDSSDEFYGEVYDESLSRVMVSLNRLLYSNYFSKKAFQEMSNDEIDVLMDDFVDEGLFTDIYDFKLGNDAILNYNVEDKLADIKAKAMVISSNDDIYYSPEFDTIPLKDKISDCEVVLFDSNMDVTGIEDLSIFKDDLNSFMESFKK